MSSESDNKGKVVVIGAGPAGLTAAAEVVERGFHATVLEKDPEYVGGIARTAHYKGYRFDIGGHRFFSKSSEVTEWWRKRLPNDFIKVRRLSRIFYRSHFFDYPLKPMNALTGLGIFTSVHCLLSYLWSKVFPIQPEKSFADWVTNRFGQKLFSIFFKTYTEKVWGMSCDEISADWAAQRIKGLSLIKAVWNALRPKGSGGAVIKTLIDEFEYPRLGPGMMWERTRDDLRAAGSEVLMGKGVRRISVEGKVVKGVEDEEGNLYVGEHFISSMPLREAVEAISPAAPDEVLEAAGSLKYRDFLTVALMVKGKDLFPDNWIYVHDPSVKLGRIQNFNNWSQEMVPEAGVTCLGLEYFCFEGDGLWTMKDEDLVELGSKEMDQLGLVKSGDVFDGCVVRMPKAYPVYDEDYLKHVKVIRDFLEPFENLQVIGRNGMHKYNNQDHSMMTALLAARNIGGESFNLWRVNTDAEYHEEGEVEREEAGRAVPRKA